jgi:peroxiredoxin Q/BCP
MFSGCTTQVCLFRDSYDALSATGLAIYGLSTDSPKANLNFKTKQNLPYPLLCDPRATLIQAIGFKKVPKGTQRGVFVVDKESNVLAVEAGGPAATVEVVKALVESMGGNGKDDGLEKAEQTAVEGEEKEVEDEKAAETAAEVADVAKGLDGTPA